MWQAAWEGADLVPESFLGLSSWVDEMQYHPTFWLKVLSIRPTSLRKESPPSWGNFLCLRHPSHTLWFKVLNYTHSLLCIWTTAFFCFCFCFCSLVVSITCFFACGRKIIKTLNSASVLQALHDQAILWGGAGFLGHLDQPLSEIPVTLLR